MTEIAGVHGPEYSDIGVNGDGDHVVYARADGDGGIVAYGPLPNTFPAGLTGDKTISCRVMVPAGSYTKLYEVANLRLGMIPFGSGWKPTAYVVTPDGDATVTGDEIAFSSSTTVTLWATYDSAAGTLALLVGDFGAAEEVGTTTFGEARDTQMGLPIWQAGAAPGGWVGRGGFWDEVIADIELPVFAPPDISGLQWWLDASDAATLTIDGSDFVTSITDKSGNGRTVTPTTSGFKSTASFTQNGLRKLRSQGTASMTKTAGSVLPIASTRECTIVLVGVDENQTSSKFVISPVSGQDHQGIILERVNGTTMEVAVGTGVSFVNNASFRAHTFAVNAQGSLNADLPRLFILRIDTSGMNLRVNGSNIGGGTHNPTFTMPFANFFGGGTPIVEGWYRRAHSSTNAEANGFDFFESMFYDSYLSDSDCALIEAYAARWGTLS